MYAFSIMLLGSSKAFRNVSNETFDNETIDVLTAYAAAATVYGNGQRSGALTKLSS